MLEQKNMGKFRQRRPSPSWSPLPAALFLMANAAAFLAGADGAPPPSALSPEIPCQEFHPRMNFPCLCGLNDINATRINCDGAVFVEFPLLPYRFYIQEFSQRDSGLQTLGAQLFTASDLPLTRIDFGNNKLRRLSERLFDGIEDTLEEIDLGHNLLGDNLNPVFSTGELKNLKFLRHLDLSYNMLNVIEEGILEGCAELKVGVVIPKHSQSYARLQ